MAEVFRQPVRTALLMSEVKGQQYCVHGQNGAGARVEGIHKDVSGEQHVADKAECHKGFVLGLWLGRNDRYWQYKVVADHCYGGESNAWLVSRLHIAD